MSADIGEHITLADRIPDRTQAMRNELLRNEQTIGNPREKGRAELERRLEKLKARPSNK